MRLKELSESVAKACDLPARSVLRAQMETFRQLRVAVEGGDRITIPGFGIFFLREIAAADGKPAEKIVRLKMRDEVADTAGKNKGGRADEAAKKKDERADEAAKKRDERAARAETRKAARAKGAKGEPEGAE